MAPSGRSDRNNRPRISVEGAIFATVIVGHDKTRFSIHEDLLTYHSPFFRAALQGSFKEAKDKTVTLADEDPTIFEFFIHWLYYQRLPTIGDAEDLLNLWTCEDPEDYGETRTDNLVHLHIFSDKYDVPLLRLETMSDLYDYMYQTKPPTKLPTADRVADVFEQMNVESGLHRFLVDSYCLWTDPTSWDEVASHEYPPRFLSQVLRRYGEIATGGCEREMPDVCNYHEHRDEKEREACDRNYHETPPSHVVSW